MISRSQRRESTGAPSQTVSSAQFARAIRKFDRSTTLHPDGSQIRPNEGYGWRLPAAESRQQTQVVAWCAWFQYCAILFPHRRRTADYWQNKEIKQRAIISDIALYAHLSMNLYVRSAGTDVQ